LATPLFPALIAALLVAAAAVVIWIELLLREVAIYAVVLFFPLALAGLVWDASRAWSRRLAEMLAALIFSKFVIVAILALASGGLASGSEGFGGVLVGASLLLVAAFAPILLMRVIGVLEVAAAASVLEGAAARHPLRRSRLAVGGARGPASPRWAGRRDHCRRCWRARDSGAVRRGRGTATACNPEAPAETVRRWPRELDRGRRHVACSPQLRLRAAGDSRPLSPHVD
jgi:hypothetical protein